MNIAHWLYSTAASQPHAPALFLGEKCIADYQEFASKANRIGLALASDLGIVAGDRVCVFMSNRPEYLELLYGIWWVGAIAVPVNAKLHFKEALWIAKDAEATLFVATDKFAGDAERHAIESIGSTFLSIDDALFTSIQKRTPVDPPKILHSDDLAWLFYTSGTTGDPKGVMLTHGNLIAMSLCYATDVDEVSGADATFYAAPISHGAGLYNFIHVRKGARHVFPLGQGFDPAEIIGVAPKLKNLTFFAAPTMVRRLIDSAKKADFGGDGIKTIVYGGGPMYRADIYDALQQFGSRFVQIYGQGETPMTITVLSKGHHVEKDSPRYEARLNSVGLTQSVIEVRTTSNEGAIQPTGVAGEIEVKGATVMKGYWRNEQATDTAIVDGWLKTGDIGILDEQGFLTLTDRSKDIIISGGTNIYPREVEEALLTHPTVREISVVGKPDPDWGEIVVAFVVGKGVTQDELNMWCLERIARFKRPKIIHFVPELPKNNNGKVVKNDLRAMLKRL